ncbi:MAG: hypothetical protein WCX97_04955, partial [Candidatus Magasanikbacteria bacterium]
MIYSNHEYSKFEYCGIIQLSNQKEKFAFGQHKVRADIFTGSLAVFTRRSPRLSGAGGRKGCGE